MESVKKWLSERTSKKNGLYVHYSPPKLLGVVSSAQLRQWARGGAEGRLEKAVLAGQGRRLLAEAEALPLAHHLPTLIAKCDALHAAVERGSLLELQVLLELLDSDYNRRKYIMCRDEAGVGLLHKAIFYDYMDIAEWLVKQYPLLVHQKDSEGRTPLHYAAVCRDEAAAAALLEGAGAPRGARDAAGRTPAHYRGPARTLLALPTATDMARETKNPPGLVIKRHNIRIWCHDCDMARLQRVVWEGHGTRLLSEVSNQPIVKRFLEAVPYIMNTIREIHTSVVQNDLEGLMKHAGDPVPPQALSSRDNSNMTVMHKAAGLGHGGILKFIADRYPQGINDIDNDGRTPLHYAATVRDEKHTFNTLVSLGADESAVDNKNKTPGYYINRPQEIDKNLLKTIPEAPRTASSAYPSSWDWKLLDTEIIAELNKKSRRKNLKASNENISSKNNTHTVSESTENLPNAMKLSSTREFIKDLPELDDSSKPSQGDKQDEDVIEVEENASEIHNTENAEIDNEDNHEHIPEKEPEEETPKEDTKNEDENNINKEQDNDINEKHDDTNEEHDENNINNEDENNTNKDHDEHNNVKNKENSETEKYDSEHDNETNNEIKFNNEAENKTDDKNDNLEQTHIETENADHVKESNNESNDRTIVDNVEEESPDITEIQTQEYKNEDDQENKSNDQHIEPEQETSTKEDTDDDKDHNNENKRNESAETEEAGDTANEGNFSDPNEDDDDVQVQGYTHSEYSDTHIKNTAEMGIMESAKRGNLTNGRNTQESLIAGIVSGEAEQDSQDASIAQRNGSVHGEVLVVDNEIDPEVTELINNANMEMLATLVLNGEGSRLIGRQSRNSELQAFLDNVPIYMQKISKVHSAAREGNIRDLQAALDRRKFAIARDPISPNGATPLHVATVFGKTNIMKYLGGRFPETLSAVDFEGRTALHYAAILPDNGYYYNLLQQLGANSKDLDDNGQSAEDYIKNPSLLPFSQLLSDYGISEEAAQDMLSDKVPEDHVSSRRSLDVPEALDTLERCYRLLASARPTRTPLSASSNRATPPLVLGRFLKRPIFDIIKHRVTKLDHDLFDVIWPAVKKLPDNRNIIQTVEEDFPGGITAPDYYIYEVFHEFITPLIKDLHNINVHSDLSTHPPTDFTNTTLKFSLTSSEPFVELNVDPNDEFVLSGTIECSRNLEGFELPLNLKVGKLETIERILTTILMQDEFAKFSEASNPESDQKGGTYYTLNEVLEKPSEICATLASSGLLVALCERDEIDDCTRLHGQHWPYGRGVFVSEDKTVAIWINVHDHLRVLVSTPSDSPGEIGLPFSKLAFVMSYLHERLDFIWDDKLGHLSSRPTFLGAGLRFSLIVNFPGLSKDSDNMKHLCAMRGLQYRETLSADIARISNYQCLSITEINCFNDFATASSNLLHLEKDLSMQNSAHIATMLSNIFRRKRSSLAELDIDAGYPTAKCIGLPDKLRRETGFHMDDVFAALGDPLIKGLTEVANVKPKDPVAFLASFLHNFPDKEKPQLGTQETNMIVTRQAAEVENDQPPPVQLGRVRSGSRTTTKPHRPIDVVTVDPLPETSPDGPETAFSSATRDEHGQSMLHFAAARTHTRNALFQLLQESDISLGYRDELYRTARDVSIQANVLENTAEIDRWVLHLAARGNKDKIMELLLEGYDHILDVIDEEGMLITDVIAQRGDSEMGNLLSSIPTFEESREYLHGAVRRGDLAAIEEALSAEGGRTLARAQNSFGRTALHIAVLAQNEEIVAYLAQKHSELLRIGDNLERTPLHYAMGVEKIESLSRVLIRAGAKRVLKDLKGRQPSYYFMNKSDILRLKEEEEVY
ncbi:uncharacterized protein ACR2FA_000730 [Aphomia sociella]